MAVSETEFKYEYNVLSEPVPISVLYFHIQVAEDTVLTRHFPTSSAN